MTSISEKYKKFDNWQYVAYHYYIMHISALQEPEVIIGRKTFFIGLAPALLPAAFPETLLASGFEAYNIQDDDICPLTKKIELLCSRFVNSDIFLYVDAPQPKETWKEYVASLQESLSSQMSLTILYADRGSSEQNNEIEQQYDPLLGAMDCCIPLSDDMAQNLNRIVTMLREKQSSERRKTFRANCSEWSTVSFFAQGKAFNGHINDISVDYFSCHLEQEDAILPCYEKISSIALNVEGTLINSDAVLLSERSTANGKLYVFSFCQKGGASGLDNDNRAAVLETLYQMVTERELTMMQQLFTATGKQFRAQNPYA